MGIERSAPVPLTHSGRALRSFVRELWYLHRMESDDASRGWDQHAVTYARMFAPMTGVIARSMFSMVEPRLPEEATVLDIACGTGALTLPAVERALRLEKAGARGGRIVATDFSPAMVELTRGAGRATGAPDTLLHCEVQNGEALTYADASFDAAFSSFGIFLFHDRRAGWREAARVLRPGGIFATSVWQGPATNALLRAQMEPIMRALPPHLVPQGSGGWMEIAEAAGLVTEVEASAPFKDVQCYPFRTTLVLNDLLAAWEAMRNNPVLGALLSSCNDTELAVVKSSVLESFTKLAGGEGRPLLLEAVCNILIATRR